MYDKFDQLATEAESGGIAVSVLANGDVSDIEMLPIAPRGYGAEKVNSLARQWAPRQLRFIGTIAFINGKTRVAFAEPLEERTVEMLATAFATYCSVLGGGDEVAWLEKLHSLPDSRTIH